MEKPRLFPNHTSFLDASKCCDECEKVPAFVTDLSNSNIIKKPYYPKDLVYTNNMDLSMEEMRAQRYLTKYNITLRKDNF